MRVQLLRHALVTSALLICSLVLPLAPAHAVEGDSQLTGQQALGLIDCVDLEGKLFCTELGFVTEPPTATTLQQAFDAESTSANTGDLSLHDQLVAVAGLPEADAEVAWAQQLVSAHDALPRIVLLEHHSSRVPLPAGFFDNYPQLGFTEASPQADALRARASTGAPLDPAVFVEPPQLEEQPSADDPAAQGYDRTCRPQNEVLLAPVLQEAYDIVRNTVCKELPAPGDEELPLARLDSYSSADERASLAVGTAESAAEDPAAFAAAVHPREGGSSVYIGYEAYRKQLRDYWCGPATMQSIDGMDDGRFDDQGTWSRILGTESGKATSIATLVSIINSHTTWDTRNSGGKYVERSTHNVGARTYYDWHVDTLAMYRRPIVNHVRLERAFFPYFQYDHSGHLQTVRGYNYDKNTLSYFQPYNERDYYSDGASSGRVHYQHYSSIYRANQHYADHGESLHVDMGV